MGFVHVWELGLTYNITRSYTVERQVWFTCMFVIDIYNEKSEDLSTIHLSQFLFCPYAIIPPCNYICQIYLLKKERDRGRQKKKIIVFCLCPLYNVKIIKISVTHPHTYFFLRLLSLSPTVCCLKNYMFTIKF